MNQNEPIRLARMDIASRGGMGAWKAFGLQRVPAVKVDKSNNKNRTSIDEVVVLVCGGVLG